jgi:hypothetical protein
MKYEVLKNCVINRQPMTAGSVVEVSGDDEKTLLSLGRIAPYSEPVIENRSVGLEDSPEKPKRRKKNAS